METNNYNIHICTSIEQRSVGLGNTTIDEAVSVGIVFFDKFATKIGDYVIIAKIVFPKPSGDKFQPLFPKQIFVRKITLKEGLKVEVEVL